MRATNLLMLFSGLVVPALFADSADDWTIERREWHLDAAEVLRVRVENPYGDVRVRPSSANEAYVLANVQRHVEDPNPAQIEPAIAGEALLLAVAYLQTGDDEPAAWRRRRVDLTLFVPPEAALAISTASGLIEVKKTRGPLTLRTKNGSIRAIAYGSIDAESVHGAIQSDLLARTWTPPSRLSTVNGDIRVSFARETSAAVTAETRGEITTDFSLTVERNAESGEKSAAARLGSGEAELSVTSVNGSIKLLQSFLRDSPDADQSAGRDDLGPRR